MFLQYYLDLVSTMAVKIDGFVRLVNMIDEDDPK